MAAFHEIPDERRQRVALRRRCSTKPLTATVLSYDVWNELEAMMITGVDHLVLTVRDLEATLTFYERVLGFRRVLSPDQPAALLFGSQKINVHHVNHPFEPKARIPTCGSADFCLVTDRPLSEMMDHIERNGVHIELGPVERIGARGPMNSIYFRDPDGNLVEISEYLS